MIAVKQQWLWVSLFQQLKVSCLVINCLTVLVIQSAKDVLFATSVVVNVRCQIITVFSLIVLNA